MEDNKLSAEDQRRVDNYLKTGFNRTPRKPFRPLRLLLFLLAIVGTLSLGSILVARLSGVL